MIIERVFPGLEVISRCIPDDPEGVYDDTTELTSAPPVVELAQVLEREGAQAIIVSCAADPVCSRLGR